MYRHYLREAVCYAQKKTQFLAICCHYNRDNYNIFAHSADRILVVFLCGVADCAGLLVSQMLLLMGRRGVNEDIHFQASAFYFKIFDVIYQNRIKPACITYVVQTLQ